MQTTNDGSHAANVANFQALITYCENTIGSRYNPGLPKLELANLKQRLTATKTIMAALTHALNDNAEAIRKRSETFHVLDAVASRVVNTFLIGNVTPAQRTTIKSILKKIQGKRITPAAKSAAINTVAGNEAIAVVHHSPSQQTYVDMVEHLHDLIEMVSVAADYNPNEPDLKLSALNTLLQHLKDANSQVFEAGSLLDKARIDRNRSLYRRTDGLVPLAKDVKLYVAGACGKNSPECKQVKSIPFRDYGFEEPVAFVPVDIPA